MHRSTLTVGTLAGVVAATTVLALGGSVAPAAATPPVGAVVPAPAPPPEAVLRQRVNAHDDGIQLKMPRDAVVRDFTLTYGVGSSSGWHRHPGIVLATVVSGTVYRSVPCHAPERFTAGQAFVEVGPHFVQNLGTTPAVLVHHAGGPGGDDGRSVP